VFTLPMFIKHDGKRLVKGSWYIVSGRADSSFLSRVVVEGGYDHLLAEGSPMLPDRVMRSGVIRS
jgi:hypothetical protein